MGRLRKDPRLLKHQIGLFISDEERYRLKHMAKTWGVTASQMFGILINQAYEQGSYLQGYDELTQDERQELVYQREHVLAITGNREECARQRNLERRNGLDRGLTNVMVVLAPQKRNFPGVFCRNLGQVWVIPYGILYKVKSTSLIPYQCFASVFDYFIGRRILPSHIASFISKHRDYVLSSFGEKAVLTRLFAVYGNLDLSLQQSREIAQDTERAYERERINRQLAQEYGFSAPTPNPSSQEVSTLLSQIKDSANVQIDEQLKQDEDAGIDTEIDIYHGPADEDEKHEFGLDDADESAATDFNSDADYDTDDADIATDTSAVDLATDAPDAADGADAAVRAAVATAEAETANTKAASKAAKASAEKTAVANTDAGVNADSAAFVTSSADGVDSANSTDNVDDEGDADSDITAMSTPKAKGSGRGRGRGRGRSAMRNRSRAIGGTSSNGSGVSDASASASTSGTASTSSAQHAESEAKAEAEAEVQETDDATVAFIKSAAAAAYGSNLTQWGSTKEQDASNFVTRNREREALGRWENGIFVPYEQVDPARAYKSPAALLGEDENDIPELADEAPEMSSASEIKSVLDTLPLASMEQYFNRKERERKAGNFPSGATAFSAEGVDFSKIDPATGLERKDEPKDEPPAPLKVPEARPSDLRVFDPFDPFDYYEPFADWLPRGAAANEMGIADSAGDVTKSDSTAHAGAGAGAEAGDGIAETAAPVDAKGASASSAADVVPAGAGAKAATEQRAKVIPLTDVSADKTTELVYLKGVATSGNAEASGLAPIGAGKQSWGQSSAQSANSLVYGSVQTRRAPTIVGGRLDPDGSHGSGLIGTNSSLDSKKPRRKYAPRKPKADKAAKTPNKP